MGDAGSSAAPGELEGAPRPAGVLLDFLTHILSFPPLVNTRDKRSCGSLYGSNDAGFQRYSEIRGDAGAGRHQVALPSCDSYRPATGAWETAGALLRI